MFLAHARMIQSDDRKNQRTYRVPHNTGMTRPLSIGGIDQTQTQAQLDDGNRMGRYAWQPRKGNAPWRRNAKRVGGEPREPIAPWELPRDRATPRERKPNRNFEGIEALQRNIEAKRKMAEQARREAKQRTNDQSTKDMPDTITPLPEDLRQVVPREVRAKPLFGSWWTVQIRISKDSTWWPITGTATTDPDAAQAIATRIRNAEVRVLSDRQGNEADRTSATPPIQVIARCE